MVKLLQKSLSVELFVLVTSVCAIGVQKTERAFGIAAEAHLEAYIGHTCAYLTTGDKWTCTNGLMATVEM